LCGSKCPYTLNDHTLTLCKRPPLLLALCTHSFGQRNQSLDAIIAHAARSLFVRQPHHSVQVHGYSHHINRSEDSFSSSPNYVSLRPFILRVAHRLVLGPTGKRYRHRIIDRPSFAWNWHRNRLLQCIDNPSRRIPRHQPSQIPFRWSFNIHQLATDELILLLSHETTALHPRK
jgi:hypothetical protein